MSAAPPVALTIAGSDPSGGAGIQADLKTFSALGAYGTAVLTALTAQSTQGVTGVHVVPPDFVREQLETLVEDVAVDVVKIGMLAGAETVEAVTAFLAARAGEVPVVLDPVMVSTAGSRLLDEDAVQAILTMLPHVSVVTPNLAEAGVLTASEPATDLAGMREQAAAIRALGAPRVLVKGGHLAGSEVSDLWLDGDGEQVLSTERVDTRHTHGTGCTLSSAITALQPQRRHWLEATRDAKAWLTGALRAGEQLRVGQGPGPVHHFHEVW
ncbi:bifunctional hydroxymethylpyrimidine kinase/phosphomethylpyrimidine kinase [Bogoriella caseilytica]|uniref:Hydroxymethylpyrimidine/phosphomethylpyrimidine kinase n=1 Tax=Bogoriella caseilytica TaxID=56055 RepID=A0A3N2BC45_9MICO|nr:bifunctional hydroxymethylpyrimidine kinase/phosphomethylpyrimidine kinase [Bogoriella caseilytica]ROR72837.1 hydroxymethylpyrimidine/phosphomethylpyrimidine kinase [Bogoriella caseilytica]